MKKRLIAFLLAGVLAVSAAGCGEPGGESGGGVPSSGGSETANGAVWDPYTPYPEAISFTKGVEKGSNTFPEGDDFANNDYTRFVKEQLNVETKIAWEVDSNNLNQKIALSIASREIPDMMVVDRKIFKQLIENDMIWDMTEAYEKCISPFLKEQYDTYGDRLFDEVTVDGRMMGIPATNIGYCHNVLWIRKDWLETLGMEPPETVEDIVELARAFVEEDPGGNGTGNTVGLTATDRLYNGYNSRFGLDTIFAAYGAYPGSWVLDEEGKAVYGSTMEGMKPALELMRSLYAEGILDKEFAVRKGEDQDALLASGKMGMYFGVWWPAAGHTAAVENNPDADWIAVSAPVNEEGKLTAPENDPLAGIVIVSKEYDHPEAIVKCLNVGYDSLRGNGEAGAESYEQWNEHSPGIGWNAMPIPIAVDYNNAIEVIRDDIMNAVEADDVSVMKSKGFEADFERVQYELANPRKDINAYLSYQSRIVGAEAAMDPNLELIPSAFFGTTDTMATKWTNLQKLETETLLQIVMGEKPVDEFDQFVEQWYALGGQEILDEIEAERAGK